jgi:hypothetical protein
MAAILGASQPLLHSRILEEAQAAASGPEARSQAVKKAGQWLARYKDPVGREVWMVEVEKKLGVSRQLLQQAMGLKPTAAPAPIIARPAVQASSPRPVPRPVASRAGGRPPVLSSGDRTLLRGIARGGEFVEMLLAAASNCLKLRQLPIFLTIRARVKAWRASWPPPKCSNAF